MDCPCILASNVPVGLAAAVLLCLLWVLASVTVLGEETREMLLGCGGAVRQTLVVLVVELVRASHCVETSTYQHADLVVDTNQLQRCQILTLG